jgi:hypothetical protein
MPSEDDKEDANQPKDGEQPKEPLTQHYHTLTSTTEQLAPQTLPLQSHASTTTTNTTTSTIHCQTE